MADEPTVNADVRRAFQASMAQLVTVLFLVVLYYVYIMLEEMIKPVFWALFFSIILKAPKDAIKGYLWPLIKVELRYDDPGSYSAIFGKFIFIIGKLGVYVITVLSLLSILCIARGWSLSVSIVLSILILMILLCLALFISMSESESHDSLASVLLVGFLFFFLMTSSIFFVFKAALETTELVIDTVGAVNEVVSNSNADQLSEYGITPELINESLSRAYDIADEWAAREGYNLTEMKLQAEDIMQTNYTVYLEQATEFFATFDISSLDDVMDKVSAVGDVVDLDTVTETASDFGEKAMSFAIEAASYGVDIILFLVDIIMSSLEGFVFTGALYFFLESEVISEILYLLPVSNRRRNDIENLLRASIFQVFYSSGMLCILNGVSTWIYFTAFNMPFAYSAALLTGIVTLFPLLSPWLIFLPSLGIMYLKGRSVLPVGAGLLVWRFLLGYAEDAVDTSIPGAHPYFSTVSIVLGISTFGVEGMLIGPMLMVWMKTFYGLIRTALQDENEDNTKWSGWEYDEKE